MADKDSLDTARAMRREVLGDAYVDRYAGNPNPATVEFQEYLTSMAWGVWTRGGPLSTRDRSLVVLAMTAAMGRMEEFALHVEASGRAGVKSEELDELLFQIAAYCGAPAGVSANRTVQEVRARQVET